MPNKEESKQLNNMEVNRIFNMKKSNLDRQNNINDGKLKNDFFRTTKTKQLSLGKNTSQIVFGTEYDSTDRNYRKSSMLPTSPGRIDSKDIESRRRSQITSNHRQADSSLRSQGKKILEKPEMEASKDIGKLLADHKTVQSRAQSTDRVAQSLYKFDTPDFLRILDK